MLALADVDSGRLLRTLSLHGPTTGAALAAQLALTNPAIDALLEHALQLGAVRRATEDCYRIDEAAVIELVRQNRMRLLGAAA